MSRKRNHRMRSRVIAANPVQFAIAGAALVDGKMLDDLRLREAAAIEAFKTGAATDADLRWLADVANTAEVMAQGNTHGQKVGPEVLPFAHAAIDALERAVKRHDAGKPLLFDGDGLKAFEELLEYHDLQRTSISRGEYERWVRLTNARVFYAAKQARKAAAT